MHLREARQRKLSCAGVRAEWVGNSSAADTQVRCLRGAGGAAPEWNAAHATVSTVQRAAAAHAAHSRGAEAARVQRSSSLWGAAAGAGRGDKQRVTAPEPPDAAHTRTAARLGALRGARSGRAAAVARCSCSGGAFCGSLAPAAAARSALAAMAAARVRPGRELAFAGAPLLRPGGRAACCALLCAPNRVICAVFPSRRRHHLKQRGTRGFATPGARPWLRGCCAAAWLGNARCRR